MKSIVIIFGKSGKNGKGKDFTKPWPAVQMDSIPVVYYHPAGREVQLKRKIRLKLPERRFMMGEGAAVVIPLYKKTLNKTEKISLMQLGKVLAKHHIIFVSPKGVNTGKITGKKYRTVVFDKKHFSSVHAYSRLLRSKDFYEPFKKFKYILIAQLDSFVFSDKLDYWCKKDFDYIGAPWIFEVSKFIPDFMKKYLPLAHRYGFLRAFRRFSAGRFLVGNGGFSLRKVKTMIDVLDRYSDNVKYYDEQAALALKTGFQAGDNEDAFWGIFVPYFSRNFRIPCFRDALKFSFEVAPKFCYSMNNKNLPFGCHAWDKHDPQFWKEHIKKAGFNL